MSGSASPWPDLLVRLGLPPGLASQLEEAGIDDRDTLLECSTDELKAVGIKLGHAKKLLRVCHDEASRASAPAGPAAPVHGAAAVVRMPPSRTPTPTGLLSEVQRASLTITPGSVCDHAECSRAAAAGFSHCCKECASWGPKFHTGECEECKAGDAAEPPAVPSTDDEHSRRFKKLSWLGRGAFGVTRKMEDTKTGLVVAMKTITCNGLSEANSALKEATATINIEHPNIVTHRDCWLAQGEDRLFLCNIVMEYCDGGDLAAYISNAAAAIPGDTISQVLFGPMLKALSFLHSRNIMHRDIKPANILLMNPTSDDAPLVPKLCDFGLATEHLGTMANTMAGTQAYMAPEVTNEEAYNSKADVWSLGVTAAYAMTRTEPRGAMHSEAKSLKLVGAVRNLTGYSPELVGAVSDMLTFDPLSRPSPDQLLKVTPFAPPPSTSFADTAAELLAALTADDKLECKHDFFLSHYQGTGGDQVATLNLKLKERGFATWYDQEAANLTAPGMMEGIKNSRVFLLFLSDGVLGRDFVRFEARCALKLKKPIVLMHEEDERHGKCDFGKEAGLAPDDLKPMLANNESIPWRRRKFEQDGVLDHLLTKLPRSAIRAARGRSDERKRQEAAAIAHRRQAAELAVSKETGAWGKLMPLYDSGLSYAFVDDEFMIGRSDGCKVTIKDKRISNQHCRIKRVWNADRTAFTPFLKDVSKNGTWVQGDKLGKNVQAELRHHDTIGFVEAEEGASATPEFRFVLESAVKSSASMTRTSSAPSVMVKVASGRGHKPVTHTPGAENPSKRKKRGRTPARTPGAENPSKRKKGGSAPVPRNEPP